MKADRTKAIESITALRILQAHGMLSPEEHLQIQGRIMDKFGAHLSPLRVDNEIPAP
jgi:hypothetical protein